MFNTVTPLISSSHAQNLYLIKTNDFFTELAMSFQPKPLIFTIICSSDWQSNAHQMATMCWHICKGMLCTLSQHIFAYTYVINKTVIYFFHWPYCPATTKSHSSPQPKSNRFLPIGVREGLPPFSPLGSLWDRWIYLNLIKGRLHLPWHPCVFTFCHTGLLRCYGHRFLHIYSLQLFSHLFWSTHSFLFFLWIWKFVEDIIGNIRAVG